MSPNRSSEVNDAAPPAEPRRKAARVSGGIAWLAPAPASRRTSRSTISTKAWLP
jgi:hypothetical protein